MNPSPFLYAINHLLAQQPEARAILASHHGKVARLDAQMLSLRVQVRADGTLAGAAADLPANVTIRMQLADLPLLLQNRERAFSYVKLEGDADFANALSQVSQSLRWDAESDLSKVIGDVAAVRLAGSARSVWQGIAQARQKVAENVAEYLLEEKPTLVRRSVVDEFTGNVTKLRDDVERLMKRIEKLEGRR